MKRKLIFCLLLVWLSNPGNALPDQPAASEILPDDFISRAFSHVIYLAGLGHRQIGTENDRLAVQYIKDQFENMNIEVAIQPFEFESFEYTDVRFEVGGRKIPVTGLGLDPYANKRAYSGTALLIDANKAEIPYAGEEIEGKTIITNNWLGHFRLLRYKPELIVYVDSLEFEKLKSHDELSFKLDVEGQYRPYRSANVIGTVGAGRASSNEILITAHLDTYRKNNPGASDNASGIGVILELARFFKKMEDGLSCSLKFIAFGGEEVGLIGSRSYLKDNTGSIKKCELLFNIDDVGGSGTIVVEMTGGVSGTWKTKGVSQIPQNISGAWEGIESKWRILADDSLLKIFSASNHPQWLVDAVNKSIKDLGYEIKPTGTQGSDQLAFAQAGIVTSGVGIISRHSHTPRDIPENINKQSLKIAGEIAAHVLLNTLERFKDKE